MKKTFTILFTMVASALAMAQERVTLATLTFPDTYTEDNGSIAGSGCNVTYTNVSATETARLEGKVYHKMTENTSSITIALSEGELRGGDVISIHLLNSESNMKKLGFFVKATTTGSNKVEDSATAGEGKWVSYTLTEEDLNEDGSVTIIRGSTYKYNYVRELTVEGEERKAEAPTKHNRATESIAIATQGNTIILGEERETEVYSLSGAMIYRGKTQQVTVPNKGIYIVVSGNKRTKVSVK